MRGLSAQWGWSDRALATEPQDFEAVFNNGSQCNQPIDLGHSRGQTYETGGNQFAPRGGRGWRGNQIQLPRGSKKHQSHWVQVICGTGPQPCTQCACQEIWGQAALPGSALREKGRRLQAKVKCSLRGESGG